MKNNIINNRYNEIESQHQSFLGYDNPISNLTNTRRSRFRVLPEIQVKLPEILVITSYPPRECGIATYSNDLIKALNNKFSNSFSIKVCALETGVSDFKYPDEVKYKLDTTHYAGFMKLAESINNDDRIQIVLLQHEFGFFNEEQQGLLQFLYEINKPVITVFHTVLPHPDEHLKTMVKNIVAACKSVIVMTHTSSNILMNEYGISNYKISVIPHGTHLVPHLSEKFLKNKYGLVGKKVLTTFGLISSGKSLETTLKAMPAIVEKCPRVMFLIIGKTHPEVVKREGEKYRESLEQLVISLNIENNVKFINQYLSTPDLLEYLQLTDIYLFTSNDPNQAVSGTFVYAMSCACPIISTPIPHAKEILSKENGILFDFNDSEQLAESVTYLLNDKSLRKHISTNTLQNIVSTAWENSAIEHAMLFEKMTGDKIKLRYNLPQLNLNHLKEMTTDVGMIQFSKVNQPDINSGYTLDDNARALIALCMYFKSTNDSDVIPDIHKYLQFIKFCQQPNGNFLNYVDKENKFTNQNKEVNLDDSNGRAIWALGYLISLNKLLPVKIITQAKEIFENSLLHIKEIKSTRSMAFIIKGIYFSQKGILNPKYLDLTKILANRLVQMYKHESSVRWEWFEGYLTYANSILPEAMLYAWLMTDESTYKDIARTSFNFLLTQTFNENGIEVISNRSWLQKGQEAGQFGEQPIDVAYTIMTLSKFYDVFLDEEYRLKMQTAFNWFLGNNRLHQIIYNPCTGGCYDGMEETHVSLNQGAESTVSYLMARLTIEKYNNENRKN
jgi:glycosyltransferase involved in cell wall biosynthesis